MFTAPAQVSTETPAQRAAIFTAKAHDFARRAQAAHGETGRAWNEAQAEKYLRFASTAAARVPAPVEVAPVAAPVALPKAQPMRSERVQAMRRFYACALSAGLDCKAGEAMTEALSKYLGVVIPSRSVLAAGHWCEAAAAVELGILAW